MIKTSADSKMPCCPRFEPGLWDEKEMVWKDKLFVKEKVSNFFRAPPDFKRTIERVKKAGALPERLFMLSQDNELWSSEVYVAAEKPVPKAEMVMISGTFMSKVFEGPYRNADVWLNETEQYVKSRGKQVKRMFFFYTVCPKCNEYYGKEYTAILAEV